MRAESSKPDLILASASPRRCELLREAGYEFVVYPAHVDEDEPARQISSPVALAETLSFEKAMAVAARLKRGVVLGADTVVSAAGAVYGKAIDEADARRILTALMLSPHDVITGVTVVDAVTGQRETAHDTTRVEMASMSAVELEQYISSGLWQGKAGAYGIQDHGDAFVRSISGSFSNVIGLPMDLVRRMLAHRGILPALAAE